MRVLGFMTGTSLDAVDMAVLETDGETIAGFGPAGERKLDPAARSVIEAATRAALAWPWDTPRPEILREAEHAIAEQHLIAAREFMAREGIAASDLDLVGVHGQTVLHEPPNAVRARGRTIQLIDARRVADGLGLPVAFDFRTADVAAGGQGAPLAPIYHCALARWSGLALPAAVLNLGGVGNVTLVRSDGELEAYDTGPANGMIDLFVQARTGARCDLDGALAAAGRVSDDVLAAYLAHDYFAVRGPKSLDRYDFSLDPVSDLSLEDGAATLTAFAAEAVDLGLSALSEEPRELILTGGGRLNPVLRQAIADLVECPVRTAEDLGWRGDSIEAEAFAYLAARTARALPISYPGTTGVPTPMPGGAIVRPRG
ncbi:MAG TPA: anhydro-N-acetylmuramic acid kinase [Caulobacteraceae bacterium]|jgi:anhydro-N-acetylmuramic acid kinase